MPSHLRRTFVALTAAVALTGVAHATHNEPLKGTLYKAFLMTSHAPCTSPNTMTSTPGLVLPACTATRLDPACGYGAKGIGKVTIKAVPGDVQVKAVLAGLEAGCENETLTLTITTTNTTDDCSSAPAGCTVAGTVTANTPVASCVVTKGKCVIKSSVNTFSPGTVEATKRAGWEIQTARVRRGTLYPFTTGLMVP
jgi:hypothetical protein